MRLVFCDVNNPKIEEKVNNVKKERQIYEECIVFVIRLQYLFSTFATQTNLHYTLIFVEYSIKPIIIKVIT